ncbi:hypothetical protein [Chitinimonas lacunae]|uniref:Nucleoside-diphosphate sugar epimerase n=1 Tax=Chitinimonas lacunae TaxID=1963018 RepID=A0ABV8MM93_9NEIS
MLDDERFRPPLAPPEAVVAGAVGRVGEALLNALVASERYGKLHVLTRQTLVSAHRAVADWCVAGRLDHETLTLAPPPPVQDAFLLVGGSRLHSARDRAAHMLNQHEVAPLAQVLASAGARRLFLVCPVGPLTQMSAFQHFYAAEAMPQLIRLPFHQVAVLLPTDSAPAVTAHGWRRLLQIYLSQFQLLLPRSGQSFTPERFAEAVLAVAAEEKPGLSVHDARALWHKLGVSRPPGSWW